MVTRDPSWLLAHEAKRAPKLDKPAEAAFTGRESVLQEHIKNDLRFRRFYVISSIFGRRSTIEAGCPDIIAAGPNGITLWIETKVKGGKLSPEQNAVRHVLLALGHHHWTLWSYGEYLTKINELLKT